MVEFSLKSTHPEQPTNLAVFTTFAMTYSKRVDRLGLFIKKDSSQVSILFYKWLIIFSYEIVIFQLRLACSLLLLVVIRHALWICEYSEVVLADPTAV